MAEQPKRDLASEHTAYTEFLMLLMRWRRETGRTDLHMLLELHVRFEQVRYQYLFQLTHNGRHDADKFETLRKLEDQLAECVLQGQKLEPAEADLAYQRTLWLRATTLRPHWGNASSGYLPALDARLRQATARRLQAVVMQLMDYAAAQRQTLVDQLQAMQPVE